MERRWNARPVLALSASIKVREQEKDVVKEPVLCEVRRRFLGSNWRRSSRSISNPNPSWGIHHPSQKATTQVHNQKNKWETNNAAE